jgi:predicted TIM-barrel fold metal-dependent hydrolase
VIIDGYTHGIHGQYLDEMAAVGGDWAKNAIDKLVARTREVKPHITNVTLRVEQLDRNGIDLQVVVPFHGLDSNFMTGDAAAKVAYAKVLNNGMTQFMEDSKGRVVAGGTVPLEAFEHGGRREMERAIRSLGLKAILVVSNIAGKPLDLPEFEPFWAAAAEMGVTVYIHPADSTGERDRSYEADYDLMHNFGWPFETELMMSRLVFSGIMERYPSLKIVTHHLGGGIPFFWGRINETYDPSTQPKKIGRVLSKPLFDYFSRFYYDTAVGGNGPAIRCAYEVFGADQLVFATDYPFGPGTGESRLAEYPKVIESLGFSEADSKKIFEDNARRILSL